MIILLEEPELYLHPGYQQRFYDILRKIGRNNRNQVVYTTHSSFFVDVAHFDEICLVRRENSGSTRVIQLPPKKLVDDLKNRHPSVNATTKSIKQMYSRFLTH